MKRIFVLLYTLLYIKITLGQIVTDTSLPKCSLRNDGDFVLTNIVPPVLDCCSIELSQDDLSRSYRFEFIINAQGKVVALSTTRPLSCIYERHCNIDFRPILLQLPRTTCCAMFPILICPSEE